MFKDFKKLIHNNLSDTILMFLLIIITFSALFIIQGYFGDPLIDCGRELYLPQAILEEKVLFKDIFAMYNPLGYQINAILYLIFGSSITTLKMAGIINSCIILTLIYGISRVFIKPFYSFSIGILILIKYMFCSFSVLNFVMPYSYSFIYALTFFLISVLYYLKYISSSDKKEYSYICFLFLGLSLACKPEYSLCIIPYVFIQVLNKEKFKLILLNIFIFFIPLLVSYGFLFLQGLKLGNLYEYINFIVNMFNTSEQKFYADNFISYNWGFKNIVLNFKIFIYNFFIFSVLSSILFFCFKKINILIKTILISIYVYLSNLFTIHFLGTSIFSNDDLFLNGFSWIGVALLIFIIFFRENKLLTYLAIISLFSTIRVQGNFLNFYSCQKFLIVLPLAVFLIYLFKCIKSQHFKLSLVITLIFLNSIICYTRLNILNHEFFNEIETFGKGLMLSRNDKIIPLNQTLRWINKNTKKNDTIIVLPEGIFINYLTDRKPNLKYYHLIPNHIKALGEDKIVYELSKNKPNYFIINNESYFTYGANYLCEDFGFKICNFIKNNYKNVAEFNQEYGLKFTIYKRLKE